MQARRRDADASDLSDLEGTNDVTMTTPDREQTQTNHVGALSSMDTAKMMAEMAQKIMAGESPTEGNTLR